MAGVSIAAAVPIYAIVHNLLHFESNAPSGGVNAYGTVTLCQRIRPHHLPYKDPDNVQHFQYGGVYELSAHGTDPIACIETWLRDTLRGSSALADLVGTRINPGPLTPRTALPAVAFALVNPRDVQGAGGVIFMTNCLYRVAVEI